LLFGKTSNVENRRLGGKLSLSANRLRLRYEKMLLCEIVKNVYAWNVWCRIGERPTSAVFHRAVH
jgi:hypothetical protein